MIKFITFSILLITIGLWAIVCKVEAQQHPAYTPPWAPAPKKEGLTQKLLGLFGGKHEPQHNAGSDYRYMADQQILYALCRPLGNSICNKFVSIAREHYPTEAAMIVNAIRNKRHEESIFSSAANEFVKKVIKERIFSRKPKIHQPTQPQQYYNQQQEDENWRHNQEVEARNHYQNAMNNVRNQQQNNPIPTYNGAPIYPSPFPTEHHH